MKNKVLIGSLAVTFLAFILYAANLKKENSAQLRIVGETSSKTHKKAQPPKLDTQKTNAKTTKKAVTATGNQKLVQAIRNKMGNSNYQVSVIDLNHNSNFADVRTQAGKRATNALMKLYILAAVYQAEKSGRFHPNSVIKIKKSDLAGKSGGLRPHMAYGVAFLRRAMMHGNKTATNAIIRKLKPAKINKVINGLGAKDTALTGNYKKKPLGTTDVRDLVQTTAAILKGKGVGRYSNTLLSNLHSSRKGLAAKMRGQVYSLKDGNLELAIVQNAGQYYAVAAYTSSASNLSKLGQAVAVWFNKH